MEAKSSDGKSDAAWNSRTMITETCEIGLAPLPSFWFAHGEPRNCASPQMPWRDQGWCLDLRKCQVLCSLKATVQAGADVYMGRAEFTGRNELKARAHELHQSHRAPDHIYRSLSHEHGSSCMCWCSFLQHLRYTLKKL